MSQPIGLLRFAGKDGFDEYIEASCIEAIRGITGESYADNPPVSRIVKHNGTYRDSMEDAEILAERYENLVGPRYRFAQPVATPTVVQPCRRPSEES